LYTTRKTTSRNIQANNNAGLMNVAAEEQSERPPFLTTVKSLYDINFLRTSISCFVNQYSTIMFYKKALMASAT
jgi:hypothetical protein